MIKMTIYLITGYVLALAIVAYAAKHLSLLAMQL